jgi:hypothetical protein
MKNGLRGLAILGIAIIIILVVAYFYLLWKVWSVFGFWNIIWTGIVAVIATTTFELMARARKQDGSVITYNPKEWPKFLAILVSGLLGFYLYNLLRDPSLTSNDQLFGMLYLLVFAALPSAWSLYKLIRDRNDFVRIDETTVSYKDNSDTGTYSLKDIKKVDSNGKQLFLILQSEETVTIDLKNMNFSGVDRTSVYMELSALITPEETAAETLTDSVDTTEA